MSRRLAIEAALAAWRDAERRLHLATDGQIEALGAEVARHRSEFLQLSGEHMLEQIDRLKGAERRRAGTVPSTPAYHDAAGVEKAIAAEIFDEARFNDEALPRAPR